ncbi:serine/threonine protein kinase [Candidatus Uhrbacteria bacterium]|nr:serine/threonine protein kinase [Candidatus Uhrbacteria bacterium]
METIKTAFATHRSGRFRVERLVGKGGMGTVFYAVDTGFDLPVAIKIINPDQLENPQVLARFKKEARIIRRIEHPSIVKVYDLDEIDGLPYIVLEWVDGGDLWNFVENNGALQPDVAVNVMVLVCAGIEQAHTQGVIHRDIKPENILLTPNGFPKITDFGIARMEDARTRQTKDGVGMGSLGYMAPEQVDRVALVDERADIHALGVTFWAIMRGEEPPVGFFFAPTIEDKPELMNGIPESLHGVIIKATALKPEARYSSVRELRDALQASLSGLSKSSQTQLFGGEGDPLRILPKPTPSDLSGMGFAQTDEFDSFNSDEHLRRVRKARRGALARLSAFVLVMVIAIASAVVYFSREQDREHNVIPSISTSIKQQPSTSSGNNFVEGNDSRLLEQEEVRHPRYEIEFFATPRLHDSITPRLKKLEKPKPIEPLPKVEEPKVEVVKPSVETVRVGFSSPDDDYVKAWLVGESGKHRLPCQVVPGTYKIIVQFAGRDTEQPGPILVVHSGEPLSVNCNSSFELCKVR